MDIITSSVQRHHTRPLLIFNPHPYVRNSLTPSTLYLMFNPAPYLSSLNQADSPAQGLTYTENGESIINDLGGVLRRGWQDNGRRVKRLSFPPALALFPFYFCFLFLPCTLRVAPNYRTQDSCKGRVSKRQLSSRGERRVRVGPRLHLSACSRYVWRTG
jgi:hypothetical protein